MAKNNIQKKDLLISSSIIQEFLYKFYKKDRKSHYNINSNIFFTTFEKLKI